MQAACGRGPTFSGAAPQPAWSSPPCVCVVRGAPDVARLQFHRQLAGARIYFQGHLPTQPHCSCWRAVVVRNSAALTSSGCHSRSDALMTRRSTAARTRRFQAGSNQLYPAITPTEPPQRHGCVQCWTVPVLTKQRSDLASPLDGPFDCLPPYTLRRPAGRPPGHHTAPISPRCVTNSGGGAVRTQE